MVTRTVSNILVREPLEKKLSLNNGQIDAYMIARDKITMQQNTSGKWWPPWNHTTFDLSW